MLIGRVGVRQVLLMMTMKLMVMMVMTMIMMMMMVIMMMIMMIMNEHADHADDYDHVDEMVMGMGMMMLMVTVRFSKKLFKNKQNGFIGGAAPCTRSCGVVLGTTVTYVCVEWIRREIDSQHQKRELAAWEHARALHIVCSRNPSLIKRKPIITMDVIHFGTEIEVGSCSSLILLLLVIVANLVQLLF
jgi:hypothetical protein